MGEFYIDDERGTIKIIHDGFGMIYIIEDTLIDLNHAVAFEASEKKRCLGFENLDKINKEEFDNKLIEHMKSKNIQIIPRIKK